MVSYLILCRSLTHAQRTARVLERSGISGNVMRTPQNIAGDGCGYCVKISEKWLTKALIILRQEGLGPKQVYVRREDNTFHEVEL